MKEFKKQNKIYTQISSDIQKLSLLTIFAFFFCFYASPLKAQDEVPVATISKSGLLVLDIKLPVSENYQADISHLQFQNEEAAKSFLMMLEDGVTSLNIDFPTQKVNIHLATKTLADANMHWDVYRWNEYFAKKEAGFKYIKGL